MLPVRAGELLESAYVEHTTFNASDGQLLDFSNDTITLIVGADKVEFTVHPKQLQKSPFFRSAIKKNWLVDRTIILPTDDATVLHGYLHFLYSSAVPANLYEALVNLYVYGEKVMDINFKNAVVGAIIREIRKPDSDGHWCIPNGDFIDILYAGTLSGSPARKLMVDLFFFNGSPSMFEKHKYNSEFLNDLVVKRMGENLKGGERGRTAAPRAEHYVEEVSGVKPTEHIDTPGCSQLPTSNVVQKKRHPRLSPDSRTALAPYDYRLAV